ncbi:MAG: SDR family NAD(P)-dependent oxidoreductase [Candidatus Krumholzibacteriota bacterium]|nr:SDR family NAD(P)-dependent oxidoreductase [Candidatus Krumholzibacteriota bacterium]
MGNNLKDKSVLVTGAGGFIGSHLLEALVRSGCRTKALLHYNSTGNIANLNHVDKGILSEAEIVFGDIRDGYFCDNLTRGVEIVFHLAALIGIPYSYVAPESYVQTNITGTVNLLNACLKNDVGQFLHTSTSEVYGSALYKPIDEKHPLQGQSPYSASKIGADKLVESYCRSFGLNAITVRPFNTFGPRQSLRAIIPTVVTQALGSDEVRVGSTHPRRDLTFVLDNVNGYLAAAGRTDLGGETINIGTGSSFSIKEMIDIVSKILDKELKVIEEKKRIRPEKSEVLELLCDNSKAKDLLGWSPDHTLEEGLREVIEFFGSIDVEDSSAYHI